MGSVLLALCALTALALPLRADDVPDAATLRADVDAARGPEPSSFRERIIGTGIVGNLRETYVRRGVDFHAVDDWGPFHYEEGSYLGDDWRQTENGIVVLTTTEPGTAAPDPVTTTVRHVTAPVDAYVLSTLDTRKQGYRDYIDPKTFRLLRRERLSAGGTTTTVYDSYARFGAQTLPAQWTVSGKRGSEVFQRTELQAGSVTDADLAIPTIKRELIAFPAGSVREELPVTVLQNRFYVHVKIGSHAVDLMLDSAAPGIMLDAAAAHDLGLKRFPRIRGVNAGDFETDAAMIPSMSIGGLQMHDVSVNIVARPPRAKPGIVKPAGWLGFDFLATIGLSIDYEHGKAYALRAGTYEAPQGRYVIQLATRFPNEVPMTTAAFDGNVADRVVVDTSFPSSFMVFDRFLRRYPAVEQSDLHRTYLVPERLGVRSFTAHDYTFKHVQVGRISFAQVEGFGVADPSFYPSDSDAIIGTNFLRLFTVDFDYPNGQIYLIPNRDGLNIIDPHPG